MVEKIQVKEFPSDSVESRQHWRIVELEKQAADREAYFVRMDAVHRMTIENKERTHTAKVLELQDRIFALQDALVKANAKLLKFLNLE